MAGSSYSLDIRRDMERDKQERTTARRYVDGLERSYLDGIWKQIIENARPFRARFLKDKHPLTDVSAAWEVWVEAGRPGDNDD